jgi:DNA-binding SARP family transcriptional activator/tetratricopeptide (TPR) repeat protein
VTGVQVRVLGPLEVLVGGQPVEVPGTKPRVLLAVLALAAGRPVAVDTIAGAVWGDGSPANLRGSLQTYVMRLRRVLGAAAIETVPGGYRLSGADVDLRRFRDLVAGAAGRPPAAERDALVAALALWRGEPLAGLPSEELARRDVPRLVEERLAVLERRIDLDLELGRHLELIAELHDLTARHPLRESLWARLVAALHRAGRTAEAIEAYHRLRTTLVDELGIDPSPELQRRFRELLAGGAAEPAAPEPAPRQLPADVAHFTGRHAEADRLDRLLAGHPTGPDVPLLVVAVDGPAGVGKTALAVHWAHRVRHRFPDGQLHLDLRGYGPAEPVSPGAALDALLRALGTPPAQVPPDDGGRAAALRTRLAGRRMILLLDDARDADQVRPLLPGTGCLVLVTSRNQLRGLISRDGAHRVTLRRLPPAEAVALLAAAVGPERAAAEPRAVAGLAELCDRLPLALRVAGEHAGRHPDRPLAALVADLREAQDRLEALADGEDPSTDLRAVFSWSYRALEPAAGRAFRLLGLHPATELELGPVAALLGVAEPEARRLLDRLAAVHLLEQFRPGRYRPHDLLRAYAVRVAAEDEPAEGRDAAVRRMLDWYAHTVAAAARLEWRSSRRLPPPEPPPADPSVTPLDFADPEGGDEAGTSWLDEHRALLIAVAATAAEHGAYQHLRCLAQTLDNFLGRREYWPETARLARIVERAARGTDPAAQSMALRSLGQAHAGLGDPDAAVQYHLRALDLDVRLGDVAGQVVNLNNLALVNQGRGRYDEALGYFRRALALAGPELLGSRVNILNGMATNLLSLGRPAEAVATCEEALAEYVLGPDQLLLAAVLDTLASAQLALGRQAEAVETYQRAVKAIDGLGLGHYEGAILLNLGRALRDTDPDAARHHWRQAEAALAGTGDPLAAEIAAELAAVGLPR